MPNRPESADNVIVRQVREKGMNDPRVLEALARVPRSRFVPPEGRAHALEDRAIEIGLDQTISQPFIVALMTAELELSGVERVLEIGTGSGYQTAVLAHLASEVFTIERFAELSLRARGILDGLGLTRIRYRIGDGTVGWADEAPFDRIIVTAGAPRMPPSLFRQLAEGGSIVAPIGNEERQQITVIKKRGGRPVISEVLDCRFVKLIGKEGWREAE
jgi:protein-L-isoaspartate(D-aspartate) O-methyltransferase